VVEAFLALRREWGSTVLMATHDDFVLTRYPAPAVRLQPHVLHVAR
jgi:ABC-type ATPase involved in cell division